MGGVGVSGRENGLCPSLPYKLRVASRAFFSTRYSQLVFTDLTVGVESSGYHMGTRVSLAIKSINFALIPLKIIYTLC